MLSFRARFVFLVTICCVFGSFCSAENRPLPVVSEALLHHAGLYTHWENSLALRKSEKPEEIFLLGEQVYVRTNFNYLFSLSKIDGMIRFGVSVADKGLPVFKPRLYEDELFMVAGNKLLIINNDFGTRLYLKRIPYSVTTSVGVNGSSLYIAGMDRRLHITDKKAELQLFEAAAPGDAMVTSVIATEAYVIFATDRGDVISMSPRVAKQFWHFETDAAHSISAAIVSRKGSLYIACRDTNLYKINILTGKMNWKAHTGAELDSSPSVTENNVYQYAPGKGLFAIDQKNGKVIWQLAKGTNLIAEAGDDAYVKTSDGRCVVMNNKAGKKRLSINFSRVSDYVSNADDSSMYLIDKNGQIVCVRPIK